MYDIDACLSHWVVGLFFCFTDGKGSIKELEKNIRPCVFGVVLDRGI